MLSPGGGVGGQLQPIPVEQAFPLDACIPDLPNLDAYMRVEEEDDANLASAYNQVKAPSDRAWGNLTQQEKDHYTQAAFAEQIHQAIAQAVPTDTQLGALFDAPVSQPQSPDPSLPPFGATRAKTKVRAALYEAEISPTVEFPAPTRNPHPQ